MYMYLFLVTISYTWTLHVHVSIFSNILIYIQSGVEYFAEEEPFVNIAPQFYSRSEYGPYCFDAAYALAFALNKTLQGISVTTVHL